MAYGILVLRLALGLSVAAHGAQELLGWFGGAGPRGTAATGEVPATDELRRAA